jgi:hypothetical protein
MKDEARKRCRSFSCRGNWGCPPEFPFSLFPPIRLRRSGGPRGLKASIEINRKERSHEPERSEELAWQEELLSGSSLTRCFLTIDDAREARYTYALECLMVSAQGDAGSDDGIIGGMVRCG